MDIFFNAAHSFLDQHDGLVTSFSSSIKRILTGLALLICTLSTNQEVQSGEQPCGELPKFEECVNFIQKFSSSAVSYRKAFEELDLATMDEFGDMLDKTTETQLQCSQVTRNEFTEPFHRDIFLSNYSLRSSIRWLITHPEIFRGDESFINRLQENYQKLSEAASKLNQQLQSVTAVPAE
jgi:hypothetical protein